MEFVCKEEYKIDDLIEIVHILRSPGGCPWDREQTHESIRTNLIEETYEVADAIDQKDMNLLQEELGDLLLQILLHSQMEKENGEFSFDDVCDGISKKLIYRHPHVFGEKQGLSSGEVLQNWEQLKNAEKGRNTARDRLDSVPRSLPALMRSAKTQKRAADFGFTYDSVLEALEDLESEIKELRIAIEENQGQAHELGDVLFSAVNVSRFLKLDAEEELARCCDRFAARVKNAECFANEQDMKLEDLDAGQRDVLWKKAKKIDQD